MVDAILDRMSQRDAVDKVASPPLAYGEIAGILGRVEAFVGMRTHSLILASAADTPVGGLIPYPKSRGYMESIGLGEQCLEFTDFSEESLFELVNRTWANRVSLRKRTIAGVQRERAAASASARYLDEWLGTPADPAES